MRKYRWIALLAALILALAGCSSLPRSGDVHTVDPEDAEDSSVGLVGQPPTEDASPEEIVLGFLVASRAGVEDNFTVARQYLLSSTSAEWDPFSQVRVYPDNQSIQTSRTSTGAVRAKVGSLGTLSSDGSYTESANEAVSVSDFSLARNKDGQWRIASLDDGVFLSEHSFFGQLYSETPIYFLSSDGGSLVADLRWFPRKEASTRAVNALLAGPSPWLEEGVSTAIPDDVKLDKPVDIEDSVATVELSGSAQSLPQDQRESIVAQITQTLMATSSVQSVKVTSQGNELAEEGGPSLSEYPYGSYGISLLSDGEPATEVNGDAVPVSGVDVKDADLEGLAVNYNVDDPTYASIGDEGGSLYVMQPSAETVSVPIEGEKLVEPSFDEDGFVWTGDRSNGGELKAWSAKAAEANSDSAETGNVTVSAPWLEGMNLRKLAVSREGSRMIAVADTGGEAAIFAAGIVRNADGEPVTLSEPIRIGQRLTEVIDVAWIGPSELVALGRTSAGSGVSLYSIQIEGSTERLAALQGTDGVALSAGRGEESVVVLTDQGTVLARSGGAWRNITTSVTAVAFPG